MSSITFQGGPVVAVREGKTDLLLRRNGIQFKKKEIVQTDPTTEAEGGEGDEVQVEEV